jgi:heptaprenyl diphosphate synthase
MTETATIYGPVAGDIPRVGERLRNLANGHHPLLNEALTYVFEAGGKRLRPAIVLLSGRLGSYDLDRLVTLAASLEVVHTATLVHDDTIDQALTRRGLRTISAVWDEKIAILIGDFLFAQSAHLAAQLDSVRIMSLLSDTVMAMSTGELGQYAASQRREVDEAGYLQRIAGKTASLFAMCCEGAAIVSGQPDDDVRALRDYGTNLGLAFQIADDVLDFVGDERTLGKPAGSDLLQGTITLPAILFCQTLPDSSPMRRKLAGGQEIVDVIAAIRESSAPDEAMSVADRYAAVARDALVGFPSSEAKSALAELTSYVVRRER